MKTIGHYLREARRTKGYTLSAVADITKIRHEFLEAIEKENWGALPEFSSVLGFVKSTARAVGMDPDQAAALLRRDYPPAKTHTDLPKPDIPKEFHWGPRTTFLLGAALVILLVLGYLGAQYTSFVRPPNLEVQSPTENEVVLTREVVVSGATEPNTTVIVNSQPALVDEDGSFTTTIEVTQNTTQIEVVARSRSGKETRVLVTIRPELEE